MQGVSTLSPFSSERKEKKTWQKETGRKISKIRSMEKYNLQGGKKVGRMSANALLLCLPK